MYKYNIEPCLNNHCWSGKARSKNVSVALVIQHVKHMQHIILLSEACLALPSFTHYLIKGTIFGKMLLNIICACIFFLQCLSETLFMLRRIECVSTINDHSSSRKVTVILVRFNKTWIFLTNFGKTLKYQISWKSHQWEISCSTWTDRQTNRHFKANSHFFAIFRCTLKIGRDNWKLSGVRGIFASKDYPYLAWVSLNIPTTD